MGDISKALELGVLEAFVDAISLRQYAFTVIRFFHFDKNQRHAFDQQSDVWSKLFIAILAGQFGNDVKAVVVKILEIDQFGI